MLMSIIYATKATITVKKFYLTGYENNPIAYNKYKTIFFIFIVFFIVLI